MLNSLFLCTLPKKIDFAFIVFRVIKPTPFIDNVKRSSYGHY
jgi:hypothetical protein